MSCWKMSNKNKRIKIQKQRHISQQTRDVDPLSPKAAQLEPNIG